MRTMLHSMVFIFLLSVCVDAQTVVVTRNANLRSDASIDRAPITKLTPGTQLQLNEPEPIRGFYHVQTADRTIGFVWARTVRSQSAHAGPASVSAQGFPAPLLAKQHPVDWWFVFKFNSATFPGCGMTTRTCLFGGDVQTYRNFSQQFVYASSEAGGLQQGTDCVGDTVNDPVGATFEEVYDGSFYYAIWNDQFYDDPQIQGCTTSCSAPWGHSKGMLAWNDAGDGFVMQVTTPSWPAAGNTHVPRKTDGNTLGCVKDNNVQVSQHFFSLKLTKGDLLKVLTALHNASVVTDPHNPQIVKNGGPTEVQELVQKLGVKSDSKTFTDDVLSTGVELISKPSGLNVPPWQMTSAILGGISLRTATWWANPKIYTTTLATTISCWDSSLRKPGAVEIATTGHWAGKEFGLTGGLGTNFNHAKIGISTSGATHLAIFGDMNQQGAVSGEHCGSSQNGRGGLFYIVRDADLSGSLSDLMHGGTAPEK